MIRLIAVDMDGTFLNSNKDYDRTRFNRLYDEMKRQGIRFVVASGNQYFQLRSFFPMHEELAFVSDNGANVINELIDVHHETMDPKTVREVFEIVNHYKHVSILVCGKKSAYLTKDQTQEFYELALNYNHRIAWIDSLDDIDDDILKFALIMEPEDLPTMMDEFTQKLAGKIVPVSSGHTAIDLIQPGVHKAHGISYLQKLWDINNDEMLIFGDNGNDIEMLEAAGIGVAVANAREDVKTIADVVTAESNDEDAVLNYIEQILNKQKTSL